MGGVETLEGGTAAPLVLLLQDAALWAGIAALLSIPVLAWRTVEGQQALTLVSRWPAVLIAAVAIFALRIVIGLVAARDGAASNALASMGEQLRKPLDLAAAWAIPAALAAAIMLPVDTVGRPATSWISAILVVTYVMLGWGLNIVVGLAGLLDLGYVAFYAVGAYSYALLAQTFGLSFWICLPLAGIAAAFWGILLGFPVLRLRGDYLAIVTLAFGEIIRIVLINWQSLTGGPNGISGIPRPSFFGLEFKADCGPGTFCGFFGIEHSSLHRIIWLYYIIVALALVTYFVTNRVRRLPIGRAWEALREDEIAARALGLNTTTVKLSAFAMGAMFGGFAGSFFATKQGFISPESFTFMESAIILAIVVLGGMGSQVGVALAALVMVGGIELFRDLELFRMLVFGLAMVLMMIWRPRGFVSSRTPSISLGRASAHLLRSRRGGPRVIDLMKPHRTAIPSPLRAEGIGGWGTEKEPRSHPHPYLSPLEGRGKRGNRMTAAAPLLEVDGLTMRFGGLVAVDRVTFAARRGHITALIGPNGAGKTTVFNCITGFYKPSAGSITLTRSDSSRIALHRMPDFRINRSGVARTFQNIRLFAGMTCLENLMVAQHNRLMRASLFRRRPARPAVLAHRGSRCRRACRAMAEARAAPRARRPRRRRPLLRRAATSGDRARAVHRARAALPRRARRRPQPA